MSTDDHTQASQVIGIARLVAGLLQGLALYLLYSALDAKTWPATDGLVFAPLLYVSVFVPLIFLLGVGSMRLATLGGWLIAVAAVVAALAWYGIWREPPAQWQTNWGAYETLSNLVPPVGLFCFTGVGLFIAHALIAGGDADRRFMATYPTHFDVAWKLALQLILAHIFVGVFWLVLWLGAFLFNLINIDFVERLIEHRWFAIPMTTLAAAAAIHLTDVRAALVRGTRTLVLVLLAWLLPLLAFIAFTFLIALMFTGFDPLWHTKHAASLLLVSAAILIVLINTAYQDGDPLRRPVHILRLTAAVASLLLVPLVAISGYAIWLRVAEYGWTAERVISAACLAVAVCYALGYAVAAATRGEWLHRIERWNFVTALLVLAVLGGIFSPVVDPERIAVGSQVAQLESGRLSPDQFDFSYLRWNAGRFGIEALQRLAREGAPTVRSQAQAQLNTKNFPYALLAQRQQAKPIGPAQLKNNLTVYPKGGELPESFLQQDWGTPNGDFTIPFCLRLPTATCDVYLLNIGANGGEAVLVMPSGFRHTFPFTGPSASNRYAATGTLFERSTNGIWTATARPAPGLWLCGYELDALQAGKFALAAPIMRWKDVVIAGRRLQFEPIADHSTSCGR
jgi:hypothetical protein